MSRRKNKMKNVTKILAVLLCAFMVFALSACGGNDDAESKDTKGTPTVSGTESGDSETKQTGDKDTGDGIILPEEAKITFGKDNNKQEDTTGTETDGSGKDGSAKSGGKDAGKDSGKSSGSSDTGKQTGGNSSETGKPSGDTTSGGNDSTSSETTESGGDNYSGIQWNN